MRKNFFSSTNARTVEERSADDDGGTLPLLKRSQALGVVLTVLLVGLTVCLLGLVLHKRERRLTDMSDFRLICPHFVLLFLKKKLVSFADRELVIQKVANYCRRANQVSYKYSKVGRTYFI